MLARGNGTGRFDRRGWQSVGSMSVVAKQGEAKPANRHSISVILVPLILQRLKDVLQLRLV